MASRREFLQTSALASAAVVALPPRTAQPIDDQGEALPPSIAALQSMRHRARPIAVDERRGRVAKARRLMAESSVDALMLT
ncbi:MAG TPA: twin-arginine translocation signal domain-containing protein, partial [Gemmatimonadales bacterium]